MPAGIKNDFIKDDNFLNPTYRYDHFQDFACKFIYELDLFLQKENEIMYYNSAGLGEKLCDAIRGKKPSAQESLTSMIYEAHRIREVLKRASTPQEVRYHRDVFVNLVDYYFKLINIEDVNMDFDVEIRNKTEMVNERVEKEQQQYSNSEGN